MSLTDARPEALLKPITCRPHMLIAVLAGVAADIMLSPWIAQGITRLLIGWDTGVIIFIALSMHFMWAADHDRLRRRALKHDEGGRLILPLTIPAAVASVGALIVELSAARGHPGAAWHIGLAAGTVILSWLLLQVTFAIHYAHIYYLVEGESGHRRGLEFGDAAEPDYWHFLHFSLVLGATAQTADIVIRCKRIRRIGTLHTLIAFGFNTAILATMINLAANLI